MIAHLDCSTGVSGDKFLGAVLDVGTRTGSFTVEHLTALIAPLAPEALVRAEPVTSRGITAIGLSVEADSQPAHRTWHSIRELLEGASMSDRARSAALDVFGRLAQAEARAHGCAVDDVHFHEVGAIDSIVDVVGVCAGLEALGVESLVATPPATGWGTVATSHGVLPVPAPATDLLLQGLPTVPGPAGPNGSEPGELTTPTGAALVAVLAHTFGGPPAMTRVESGYGAGTRDIGQPNVCRLTLGTSAEARPSDAPTTSPAEHEQPVVLLETNIDHLSAEALAFACEELLATDALDVWQTPVVMKKQRAAVVLSVLTAPADADRLAARITDLTGTLGVRRLELSRLVADREILTIETPHGAVRVKVGAGTARPEHDDIARIARETGASYERVRHELVELATAALSRR